MSRDSQLSGTSARLYVYSSGTQVVGSQSRGSRLRLMSGSDTHARTHAHTHIHIHAANKRRRRKKNKKKTSWTRINSAIPQPCLIPVSITQLSESRPTSLTALGQLHLPPSLSLWFSSWCLTRPLLQPGFAFLTLRCGVWLRRWHILVT